MATDIDKAFKAALIYAEIKHGRGFQTELAEKVGVLPQYIFKLLRMNRYGSENVRRKIASALGYKYEDFLDMGRKALAPELIRTLEPMRKESGFVFPRIHEDTASHWFSETARACEPPIYARLHDFRHSAATYMLANGIPVRMVQEILGHADISTTMGYLDVIKQHFPQEIGKLKFEF